MTEEVILQLLSKDKDLSILETYLIFLNLIILLPFFWWVSVYVSTLEEHADDMMPKPLLIFVHCNLLSPLIPALCLTLVLAVRRFSQAMKKSILTQMECRRYL